MKDLLSILLLWPLAAIYGVAVWLRTELYRLGWLKSHAAGVPVVSIGNITVGGTGKTPMAILVAQILMNKGVRVVVLSRGYKRENNGGNQKTKTQVVSDGATLKCSIAEAGDEPYLIAARLLGSKEKPGAMVIVGKDRVKNAKKAVELGAQAIVLDDGFQHRRLRRDLDIVLLDDQRPYGNGWLLPAGRLREPKGAMRRASAVVRTRCVSIGMQKTEDGTRHGDTPVFCARHAVEGLNRWPSDEPCGPADLGGKRVLLFSGVARPDSFEHSVEQLGLRCAQHLRFGDHHRYSEADLRTIGAAAKTCDALLTTEKDAVRLPSGWDPGKPLYVLRIGIEFVKDADTFEQLILSAIRRTP